MPWHKNPDAPPPGELIDVGRRRLHALCIGDGAPAVLLESGVAASSLSWARVQPTVATFTRACAYDRAGLAWSDPAASPPTFERICGDLDAVLARMGRERGVVLVGHSFGSLVVHGYATRRPENVAGLVLVDPPTEWINPGRERARLLRGARHLSRIGGLLARMGVVRVALALLTGGKPRAARGFARVFGPTATRTLERLVGEVRKLPPDLHPVVQAHWCQPKCFHAMAEYLLVLQQEAATIFVGGPPRGIPFVVISSGQQTADEVAAHRALADASPLGRHIVAAKSGHWIQFDEPEVIVDAVRTVVESARSAAPSRSAR